MSAASTPSLDEAIAQLPRPLDGDKYERLRRGVFDSPETDVYVNAERDFAFLFPTPVFDYEHYKPRVGRLGLQGYKKTTRVIRKRWEKVAGCFEGARSVLEIGAADGAFLAHAGLEQPQLERACLEIDRDTLAARDALPGVTEFDGFDAALGSDRRFDLVAFFHVLEHIAEPAPFLERCGACLEPGGRLVIEVPSLDDPLLSLYGSAAYEAFYFQAQHPYVYSAQSLQRLLEASGYGVEEIIHHQRYGLENHLQWLTRGEPGGNEAFRAVFGDSEEYLRDIEGSGRADSVIAIARRQT